MGARCVEGGGQLHGSLIILLDFRRPLSFFTAMRIRFLGAAPTTPAILCVPEGDDEAGK